MTETRDLHELETSIEAVVARIDEELPRLLKRDVVSADEVADLLLDVRMVLVPARSVSEDLIPG